MNKKIALYAVLGLLLVGLCGCGEKTVDKEETDVPEGYTKELAEAMFWEEGDTVLGDTVIPNENLRIYNYCPSILQADENTRYAYYCSNKESTGDTNVDGRHWVTDYIAFRKGIRLEDGNWYWSKKSYVLAPTDNSPTEGQQVCDPNVIRGSFQYQGEIYSYLMAYLCCNTRNNTFNHISFAVAQAPEGPWMKCEDINPFIRYETPEDISTEELAKCREWGYGQASMISVDKEGRVLMMYSAIAPSYSENSKSYGFGYGTRVERWNLSNLEEPQLEYETSLPINGIECFGFQVGGVTNGDYAYDGQNNRILLIRDNETSSNGESSGAGVYYVENKSSEQAAEVGDVFRDWPTSEDWVSNGISWETVGFALASDKDNYTKAHNCCIIRDEYGWLWPGDQLEVAITAARENESDDSQIATYRIHRIELDYKK